MDLHERSRSEAESADAEARCRNILANRPNDLSASIMLSQVLVQRNRIDEACALINGALAASPCQPDLLNRKGELAMLVGQVEEALACFDQAIERRLNHPRAQANLGDVLAARGDPSPRFPISVITPSIATPFLAQAVASVQAQDYPFVEHVIVADGADFHERVQGILPETMRHPIHLLALPFNVGGDGFNGHRVYGALPFLVGGRFVAFLDEDNWFEPDHLSSLMAKITAQGLAWAYALRRIVDGAGRFITTDDCESLGKWPTWNDSNTHLIDVNCYLLRRDLAIATSPLWYRRFRDEESPDFPLCRHLLKDYPRCDTSGRYSVNYRVGRSAGSVQAEFFLHGNAVMRQRYPDPPPWRTTQT